MDHIAKVESNKCLVVLLGPTGVGKTEISLKMAEYLSCPIVSSDSRQFFKELRIGTAAPTAEQLGRVMHFFIGTHSIFDEYSAGQYELDVMELLTTLFETNDTVMLVGGSMMYIDAVCNGMDDIPSVDPEVRAMWVRLYEERGLEYIQNELRRLDPKHYQEVDLKNYKRILHALEVCTQTGKPFSDIRTGIKKKRPFDILKIGLNRPRAELYERINERVFQMMEEGLFEEAAQFYAYRHLNTLNTVGYKELYEYMSGRCTLDAAVQLIQQNSRRYAKRQLTWFNRDKSIQWFSPDDEVGVINLLEKYIKK